VKEMLKRLTEREKTYFIRISRVRTRSVIQERKKQQKSKKKKKNDGTVGPSPGSTRASPEEDRNRWINKLIDPDKLIDR